MQQRGPSGTGFHQHASRLWYDVTQLGNRFDIQLSVSDDHEIEALFVVVRDSTSDLTVKRTATPGPQSASFCARARAAATSAARRGVET